MSAHERYPDGRRVGFTYGAGSGYEAEPCIGEPSAHALSLARARICTHCGQSWDNPDHVCACNMGIRHRRLAAQLVAEHAERRGPNPDDPWDADLWIGQAAALLAQIAGTP